ncbi:MAG: porphobilinogen synthase [Legionellales bacterium]|nr:porphobilinogen synthase [Legionellales bacterium]
MNTLGLFPKARLRRLRNHAPIRSLVQEMTLHPSKWVLPLFIKEGTGIKKPIPSMPGHFQLSVDQLEEEVTALWALGIRSIILFGIPGDKDPLGKDSYSPTGIIQKAIPAIKNAAPDLLVISDICLCEYTDHGHCGVVTEQKRHDEHFIDNDLTLTLLAKQAVSHAMAGTDVIAPSSNMDGMVHSIRTALDDAGFEYIPILSYSVKYASAMYGPFRAAAEGAPKFGNRQSYQMDYANAAESLRECGQDVAEGADMLMVKPAHTYLDIIHRIKEAFPYMPLGAYHTSGEFAMLKAAAAAGWIDERQGVTEVITAIHRAGADFIITYYAKELAAWFRA